MLWVAFCRVDREVCVEAQPLFHAPSAQQSNFSGQSATWVTVINKRVADGCNFTDILQNVSYCVPHYSKSLRGNKEEKKEEKPENIKRKQKLNQF